MDAATTAHGAPVRLYVRVSPQALARVNRGWTPERHERQLAGLGVLRLMASEQRLPVDVRVQGASR